MKNKKILAIVNDRFESKLLYPRRSWTLQGFAFGLFVGASLACGFVLFHMRHHLAICTNAEPAKWNAR